MGEIYQETIVDFDIEEQFGSSDSFDVSSLITHLHLINRAILEILSDKGSEKCIRLKTDKRGVVL